MTRHRQDSRVSKNTSQSPRSNDVVDMEVDCVHCTTRLYVPLAALDVVLSSLRRVGGAILICHACGQPQLVSGNILYNGRIDD